MEGAATALFPQQCFACGVASGSDVLCRACFAGLPGIGAARCPVCAIPQPLGETCGDCLRHLPSFDATRAALDYGFEDAQQADIEVADLGQGIGATAAHSLVKA